MQSQPKPDEWGELKRLLWLLVAFGLMVSVAFFIAMALYSGIVFLLYGIGPTWSGRPAELVTHPNLIFLIAALCIGFASSAVALWKRTFLNGRFVSSRTLNALNNGKWPLVGGYWKPFGYVLYLWIFGYMAWLGYEQEGLWALVLMGIFVLLYLYLAWKDIRDFLRTRFHKQRITEQSTSHDS